MKKIIEVKNLKKTFGKGKKQIEAVKGISYDIYENEIFGFLGPNGAGKTTTIKIILGLIYPDSGKILINNKELSVSKVNIRSRIGYLPERAQLHKNLTAIQTLHFFAELRKIDKKQCEEMLSKDGLVKWRDAKVGTFSKGMVQLLGIAQALLGEPELLILDEPTSGLDPRWARVLKDIMIEKNSKGTTIFFSSHLLFEVQELCNRVAILNKGKLVVEDTVDRVSKGVHLKPQLELTIKGDLKKASKILKKADYTHDIAQNRLIISIDSNQKAKVLNLLEDTGIVIQDFITKEPSLEKAFMQYIGKEADVGGEIQ